MEREEWERGTSHDTGPAAARIESPWTGLGLVVEKTSRIFKKRNAHE